MKRIYALTGALLLASVPALALDLQTARSKGLLGEMANGYVKPLADDDAAAKLALEVNNARRAEYEKISSENGQPLPVVAGIAAQNIVKKLPPGAKYQDVGGAWMTK